MLSRAQLQLLGVGCVAAVIAVYAFAKCSEPKLPALPLSLQVSTVTTNAAGNLLVQLNVTNNSATDVLIGVRSAIYQEQGGWTTNFNIIALLTDIARPRYTGSQMLVEAGAGMTLALSPIAPSKVRVPFQLEFVCFPGRTGMPGLIDKTKDKVEKITDGAEGHRLLGESFFVTSPLIQKQTQQ